MPRYRFDPKDAEGLHYAIALSRCRCGLEFDSCEDLLDHCRRGMVEYRRRLDLRKQPKSTQGELFS